MTAATVDHALFPQFSTLAPELRNQIWADALPDEVGPALYFYRKGCWCFRRLARSDVGYDYDNDENNLNFEFRYDLLDDVQFEVPLLLVNREARGIALSWVRAQGTKIRLCRDREYPVFKRPFNTTLDALYIPPDKWDEFLREPDDQLFHPDILDQLVTTVTHITRIAVPEALLRNEGTILSEMFQNYFNVKELFVVVDAQPDLQSVDNVLKLQPPWEFESTQGGAFIWNNDRGGFDPEDNNDNGHEALYRLIEEVNKGIGEGLINHHIRSFKIQPAYAVRS
ncbi:MAG: hypothetical protein M1835_005119 [Candelina submexicana]|nr:MAG: hypothetical protein M1835_005119 [Candelina submexicana]